MFGRQSSLFLAAREASCHHTLRLTLRVQVPVHTLK